MKNSTNGDKPSGKIQPKRILIVDDDPDFRELLNLILQKEGIQTITAENGEDFLNKIDDFQPDLVTLDVMMPGLTTEKILEQLIKEKCKPKIILLTVVKYPKETLDNLLKKGNIVAYINKPFDLDDFINIINELL